MYESDNEQSKRDHESNNNKNNNIENDDSLSRYTYVISIAKNLSLQPPSIFLRGCFLQQYLSLAILEKFHRNTLKICRLNDVTFENIPKSQRHYYHGNSKQLNFSIYILYMR